MTDLGSDTKPRGKFDFSAAARRGPCNCGLAEALFGERESNNG